MKPIIRRWLAEQDVEQAISHSLTQSPRAALGLVDALELRSRQHLRRVAGHPDRLGGRAASDNADPLICLSAGSAVFGERLSNL